ncbi:hypothetical protein AGR13a_Cc140023 [Agrobacterium genomosp. 13 str. CFBP 6927]|uniref:Uncharacterized protein n=1 Tax=Agrobacterium genomosp. 13 str. CFBP 6927 TaxID=1183428 RepID=A0ABP2BBB8_9HYPH|nr:hypothetical protein AGR13a_Cc140023 [Agrobacterium genomosp. 13 str. CFBP 6927]
MYCQFIAAGLREAPVVLVRNPTLKSTESEVNETLPAAAQSYQLLFTGLRAAPISIASFFQLPCDARRVSHFRQFRTK